MRAAVYEGKEAVFVREVADPVLEHGDVLLDIEACSVCGTDLRTFRHGDSKIAPPRILGHEFCGTVIESRSSSSHGVNVGDRVVMYIVLACGDCVWCQAGRANLCESRTTMSYDYDGAFAGFMRVPAKAVERKALFTVKSDASSEHMSLAEPLGCVLHAHSRLGIGLSDTVLVIGAGPIGVMHAAVSRLQGAQRVYLCDTSKKRLQLAEPFDLDGTIISSEDGGHLGQIADLTHGLGPSVTIVACSAAAAQADALQIAGKGGRVELFGGLPKSKPMAQLNTNLIHYKELAVSGSYSENRSDFAAAQALIQSARFPAHRIITHSLPLDRIGESFELMESGDALKVCIRPGE